MKRILLSTALLLVAAFAANAQRYFVIDSRYILEKMVEYKDAQTKIDKLSEDWQKDIDNRMQEVDRMYKTYQAERSMLSEETRKKREDEIIAKEKSVKDLQKERFGYEGELFKERQKLIK